MKCRDVDSLVFDTYVHVQLLFTEEYPIKPPQTLCLNNFPHERILGNWICLDMLENWSGFSNKKATGWTPGYSLLMALNQLELFIFGFIDSHIPSKSELESCKTYNCGECGRIEFNEPNIADVIEKVLVGPNQYQIYKCFFTKYHFDKSILCFGVTLMHNVCQITGLYLISSFGFSDCKYHKYVWGNEFNYIIPIFINGIISKRGFPILKRISARFWKLMNGLLVSMMKGESFTSNKLLFFYFQLKILLSKVVNQTVKKLIKDKIIEFLKDPTKRTKDLVPNLGEFFILISLFDDLSWDDIKYQILEECMNRQALWIIKAHKQQYVKKYDVKISLHASLVGFQLLILLAEFLNNKRWSLENINLQYGIPQEQDLENLQKTMKGILKINSYDEITKRLNVMTFGLDWNVKKILWMHEQNSYFLGYHVEKTEGNKNFQ
eukprot:gene7369-11691_t